MPSRLKLCGPPLGTVAIVWRSATRTRRMVIAPAPGETKATRSPPGDSCNPTPLPSPRVAIGRPGPPLLGADPVGQLPETRRVIRGGHPGVLAAALVGGVCQPRVVRAP